MNDVFTSINEMKESILWGGEVQFQDQTGKIFGITRLSNEDIVLAHGDGTNELHFKHINDLLNYRFNGTALKELLLKTEIISRNY